MKATRHMGPTGRERADSETRVQPELARDQRTSAVEFFAMMTLAVG